MSTNLKPELVEKIEILLKQKKGAVTYLVEQGYKLEKAKEIVKSVRDGELEQDDAKQESGIEASSKYVYNRNNDKYIVHLKSFAKPLVISGSTHRAILKDYSNWSGNSLTTNEICRKYKLPQACFNEYKKIFKLTHDREPLSVEEVIDEDPKDLVGRMLEEKRFTIHQEFEREDWKQTQEHALNWERFIAEEFDPFATFLDHWSPPARKPIQVEKKNKQGTKTLLVGLSDLHIGGKATKGQLFSGEEWNTEIAVKAVEDYAKKIAENIGKDIADYDKAVVCIIGDILHGLRGHTEKGTPLECDTTREDQFDAALNAITAFLDNMIRLFGSVEVEVVRGNHDGLDNYALFRAIEKSYTNQVGISFNITQAHSIVFRVRNTLCIASHGASDVYKSQVPKGGKPREAYVQSLLLKAPEKLVGIKQRIFIQGDKHHFENTEFNDFEFFMFGSTVKGDKYADHLGCSARPRQNALVIDNEGVVTTNHYYFE